MNIDNILALIGEPADEPFFIISYDTAVECLLEAIDKYHPTLKTAEMTDEDWRWLLQEYFNVITQCEGGPYAQEEAALNAYCQSRKGR